MTFARFNHTSHCCSAAVAVAASVRGSFVDVDPSSSWAAAVSHSKPVNIQWEDTPFSNRITTTVALVAVAVADLGFNTSSGEHA